LATTNERPTKKERILVPAKLVQQTATGRRKTATARVFLRPGKGQITVNNRPFENYFVNESARAYVKQPLLAVELADRFDILILANGGGVSGQAGAVRHGIARALLEFNVELRGKLKQLGFLTRDARAHERKKYGQKGARKRFQFSKR
jgi:small subunit ribosomal protein S9